MTSLPTPQASQQSPAALELLKQQTEFVYKYFEAAELEVRTTERYVLVALGAMYPYLVTAPIPDAFQQLAWYAPTLVVFFAGIRALGMGWRQGQQLRYLRQVEERLLESPGGWASWYSDQKSGVAISAGAFYVSLLALTLLIACNTHYVT